MTEIPYVPKPTPGQPCPTPPEYGQHRPDLHAVLCLVRNRILNWIVREER